MNKDCGGIRDYTFLTGPYFESNIRVKGRKRVRLERLYKRTKLEARDRFKKFLVPDKRYSMYVIEILEYEYEKHIELIFRFRDFWSNVVMVSKHKRVNYKRLFYATPLEKIRDDIKTPTRRLHELVEKERLEDKGCL